MPSVTRKSKKLFKPVVNPHQPRLSWSRLLTLAMIAAVMTHLGLSFSSTSPAPVALAQTTITVDSTADSVAADSNCTLREAITAANTDTAVDGCAAGSGADIIDLPGGTITLAIANTNENANANGDFDILQDLEINGNGTTIDGGAIARVFHIVGGTTTMTDLIITNGSSPGAIGNANARGGGVRVDAGATLRLTDVRVTANVATAGAGFYVEGAVDLNRVTIDNNDSTGGSGGGIRAGVNGAVTGTNVTISDNQATGGGTPTGGAIRLFDDAAVTLTQATIASNLQSAGGAQIRTTQNGSLTLVNSIVADPIGGVNCALTNAVIGNNNLDDGTTCGFPPTESNLNPQLAALADNGGSTPTRALSLSPSLNEAVDRVPAAFCSLTEDQRTESRPFDIPGVDNGGPCDVGAFELTDIPAIQIDDVAQDEFDSGSSVMNFTVSLTASPITTVTVDYQTTDGTAQVGDNDYVAVVSTTLTFAPGVTSQTVPVTITGDTVPEADELFTVDLSNSSWATIADNQGQGTILNDDVMPDVSISDAPAVAEGDAVGDSSAVFEVTLSVTSTQVITVVYQTSDGTAQGGIDYVPVLNGQLVFNPGEDQKTISVQIVGDTFIDTPASKNFFVDLTSVIGGANIVDSRGQAVINDDEAVALPSLSISSAGVDEGDSGTGTLSFEVRLSAASASSVSIDYVTTDGSATAGSDYTPASGTLVFPAGQTVQTVLVTIIGDKTSESDETFLVTLSNPVNAVLGTAQATGTIANDDAASSPGSSNDSDDDDDDDSGSPAPTAVPPVAPANVSVPPAADSSLPVTTLPETGFRGEHRSQMPWFLVAGIGVGAAVLMWNVQRRRKNRRG